jgi:hypothetical protein
MQGYKTWRNFIERRKGEVRRIRLPSSRENSPLYPDPGAILHALKGSQRFRFLLSLSYGAGRGTANKSCAGCSGDADFSAGALPAIICKACSTELFGGTADTSCSAVWGGLTATICRAARSTYWSGGGAHTTHTTIHAVPARALFVAVALGAGRLIGLGPSDARGGGQRPSYEGCPHQPERLTARERTACKSSSELVEGVISCFWGHWPPPPIMAGLVRPAVLRNVA